jgi:hypothetical protein
MAGQVTHTEFMGWCQSQLQFNILPCRVERIGDEAVFGLDFRISFSETYAKAFTERSPFHSSHYGFLVSLEDPRLPPFGWRFCWWLLFVFVLLSDGTDLSDTAVVVRGFDLLRRRFLGGEDCVLLVSSSWLFAG